MAILKAELKAILKKYDIDPTDKSQIWDCHGTLVLYHKAYEVIAAKESITFDPPTVIEGSSEKKTVALLVVGRMGDRAEWSIGEAAPGNNKNTYPYAMAEKRAKDRVIAKLVGLAQYVYNEDEADDFKDARPAEREPERRPEPQQKPGSHARAEPYLLPVPMTKDGLKTNWRTWVNDLAELINDTATVDEVNAWLKANKVPLGNLETQEPDGFAFLKDQAEKRRHYLAQAPDLKAVA